MKTNKNARIKRKARIRAKIFGTKSRPRIAVYRSNTAFTVQVIDDEKGHTLISKTLKGTNRTVATSLGTEIARLCKGKNISQVVFDRGGYRYHGSLAALAHTLREGGLTF
jgi:large subunit ribosomal protein L18